MKTSAETFTVVPGHDATGNSIFAVLIKRTYAIQHGKQAVRAESDAPFIKVDRYYENGNPQEATVKYENDLAPYKPATDVVVIGNAYTPHNEPLPQMDVAVEIGGFQKIIRVIGNRQCIYSKTMPSFTEPVDFTKMEIRYERAYGGWDERSNPDLPFAYPRNTMGTGFAIDNIPEVIDGLALPNLEDPEDLLTPERLILGDPNRWCQQPLPQGFGWFQRTWYPRCSFAGAVPAFVATDEVIPEEIMGIAPQGQIALARQFKLSAFDVKFNNGASYGLVRPYLAGNEHVMLAYLTLNGILEFTLPDDSPRMMLDIGLGTNELEAELHTVCIRVEDMQIDMVWRGTHEYPGVEWLPEMKRMDAEVF